MSRASEILDLVPSVIEFQFVSVGIRAKRTLHLKNTRTNHSARFHFESTIFEFEPSQGTLSPNQSQEISISYEASKADVLVAKVLLHVDGEHKILKLSAIGKFPFVGLMTEKLDFGELLIGKHKDDHIDLRNQSEVPAEFIIEKIGKKDLAFSLDCYSGVIPPSSSYRINTKFVPTLVNMFSCSRYKVVVKGGNTSEFSCQGLATGFDVYLSAKSVHFGELSQDQPRSRVLYVYNNSPSPTQFYFGTDKKGIFSFSRPEGTIKPNSEVRIVITFKPTQTMNYYKRVFCVAKNHLILYVDLIGTCYDILNKPYILYQRHVDKYRQKVIMGAHNYAYTQGGSIDFTMGTAYKKSALMQSNRRKEDKDDDRLEFHEEIPIDDPNQIVLHKEMLLEPNSQLRDVYFKEHMIDFGYSASHISSESREITMVNNFKLDIIVHWAIIPDEKRTFYVTPEHVEIPTGGECKFKVKFKPVEQALYFFQKLECYVIRKTGNENKMRVLDVEDPTTVKAGDMMTRTQLISMKTTKSMTKMIATQSDIEPPICLDIPAIGHSFEPGSQPFLPMLDILPSNKVRFLPCGVNESVYQTVQLVNTSDTPIYFKFIPDPTKTFRIFPQIGMVTEKSFTLVCIEFCPKQAKSYNVVAQCQLNYSTSNVKKFQFIGECFKPGVELGSEGKLYYPPTYMGVSTREKIILYNKTLIPLDVCCNVPEKYQSEIMFEPSNLRVRGNESLDLLCTFTPVRAKPYQILTSLKVSGVVDWEKDLIGFYNPGSGLNIKGKDFTLNRPTTQTQLTIIGAGADGYINIEPSVIDFGTVKVGDDLMKEVTLINKSTANVFVELRMIPTQDCDQAENVNTIIKDMFKFDYEKGVLNSQSRKIIKISFKPRTRFNFSLKFCCEAKERSIGSAGQMQALAQEKGFCLVTATGDFPLIKIMDIRNEKTSCSSLWKSFNLTDMNQELLSPLTDMEQKYNNTEHTNESMVAIQNRLPHFDWNFGKICMKTQNLYRKVIITVKNVGGVRSEFMFKFPNDSEVMLEPWADPGEPSEEQAFEALVLQKNLFDVKPRQGVLLPGKQMDIEVYYFARQLSEHYLNIMFQVLNGKPVILKFMGETLPKRGHLMLEQSEYVIDSMPFDLVLSITYPIQIKNIGSAKIKYEIDMTNIHKLNEENHNFRVLDIQNPDHDLKVGETSYIYTLFKPIEAKVYGVSLPMKVSDIEGVVQNLTLNIRGSGYHPEFGPKSENVGLYENLPSSRKFLPGKGSVVSLSIDEVDFGEVASNMPSRRMVILYNHSKTTALRYIFVKTGLVCADELDLEPISGEIMPNSHVNIKMTLKTARIPTCIEGEIECQIEWIPGKYREESHSFTRFESLFLRIKKHSKLSKSSVGIENRDECVLENIIGEMLSDILEDEEVTRVISRLDDQPTPLYPMLNNSTPPDCTYLKEELLTDEEEEKVVAKIEDEIRELNNISDQELERKRMFMDTEMVAFFESIVDSTLFNIMQEATFGETNLSNPSKTYIRKKH